MHEGSQTCLSGRAGHSRDGRCVVPDDMMMDATKQRGAGLRSLTRESLTSTVRDADALAEGAPARCDGVSAIATAS